MPSGADLFVVCKQCGSQVSPYITECPYCGHRLRRRAPKLPRAATAGAATRRRSRMPASLGRLRRGEVPGIRADAGPYVTGAFVLASAAVWVAQNGNYVNYSSLYIDGRLHGEWWRLITSLLTYGNAVYAFVSLAAIALFGWLLERRHGSVLVLVLLLACGIGGELAEVAVWGANAISTGANASALGLCTAWAAPDLIALLRRRDYDGDLLGVLAFVAALLAMPLAQTGTSWLAGFTGGAIGLGVGAGLAMMPAPR